MLKKLMRVTNSSLASLAFLIIAQAAVEKYCLIFFHEPKKPENLQGLTIKDLL